MSMLPSRSGEGAWDHPPDHASKVSSKQRCVRKGEQNDSGSGKVNAGGGWAGGWVLGGGCSCSVLCEGQVPGSWVEQDPRGAVEWEGAFGKASEGIWLQGICVLGEDEEEGEDGGYEIGGSGCRISSNKCRLLGVGPGQRKGVQCRCAVLG